MSAAEQNPPPGREAEEPSRPVRVRDLKRRLAAGGYVVRPELVAEAMLRAGVFGRPEEDRRPHARP